MSYFRKGPVDISKYLPAFLSKDKELKSTLDAESEEHDRMLKELVDIAAQFNVKTADWGLDKWEALYRIQSDKNIGYSKRRDKVLSRMGVAPTVNEAFLTKLVNNFIADGEGEIYSIPAEYRMEVLYHGGQVTDYTGLREGLATYVPAHIGYKLVTITRGELQYHGAGIVQSYSKTSFDMSAQAHQEVKDTGLYCAGAIIHNYRLVSISGGY